MSYIPRNAKWYLADIVLLIEVQDDIVNICHVNLTLIRADSPNEAYRLAMDLGKQSESVYQNPDNKNVTTTFVGLRDLNVIHEDLEHGSEILFEELLGLTEEETTSITRSKQELSVFRQRQQFL